VNANKGCPINSSKWCYCGFRKPLGSCALVVALVLQVSPVHCEPSDNLSDANSERRVQIDLVAQPARESDLDALLVEWFGAKAGRLTVRHVQTLARRAVLAPAYDPHLLRIWVVLASPNVARIYFADSSGHRFLVRNVPLRNGLDEFGRENLAQVIVTFAQAFIEQGISTPVNEVEAALRTPVLLPNAAAGSDAEPQHGDPQRGDAWRIRPKAFYAASAEQAGTWDHGPGIALGLLHLTEHARYSLHGGAQYQWNHTITQPDWALTVRRFEVQAAITVDWASQSRWTWGLQGGLALTHESYQPQAASPSVTVTGTGSHWRPFAFFGPRLVLSAGEVQVALVSAAMMYFSRTHFDVVRQGQPHVEFEPWIIQPRLVLEGAWQ
jgi:hypothetical protein